MHCVVKNGVQGAVEGGVQHIVHSGECWQGRCRVLSRVQGVCGGESLCRVLWRVLASCAGCCPGIECDVTGPRTFVQVSGLKLQNVC